MKAYSKSFNFFFLFLIFDHGKVVKVNKEPGSKKSCSKSEMVWWPNTFAVSMRQCHAGCKGWSKRKAEQQSTDMWLWYESSAIIFHALQANRLLLYDSASFLFFGIVVIRSYLILHHQSPTETKIPYQYLDISSQQILNKYFLTIKRVSIS